MQLDSSGRIVLEDADPRYVIKMQRKVRRREEIAAFLQPSLSIRFIAFVVTYWLKHLLDDVSVILRDRMWRELACRLFQSEYVA